MLPFHSCYFDIAQIDHKWSSSSCTISWLIDEINKNQAWTGFLLVYGRMEGYGYDYI